MNKHTKLKAARQSARLSQGELAKAAGIAQAQVSRMEKGEKWASLETLKRIAKTVKLPLHELVDEPEIFAPAPALPLPDSAAKVASDALLPGSLREFAITPTSKALKVTAAEWRALASLQLPRPTNEDGYTTLLLAIRSVTKS